MMRHFFLVVFVCGCMLAQLSAQSFQTVYPGLQGQELLDSLFDRFLPHVVLPYGMARDTLYSKVLAKDDDSLRCIYSGHVLYLDPTQDPTQYVYQNGGVNGMNAEHAYPQSKGAADGNARSDMHHLFPARTPVNEARGSLPYANIPDAQTQRWFYKTQEMSSIPSTNRDAYTEARDDAFEPREAVKGDVARAVFYFYTIYRGQANAADPNFFSQQRATLCQWQAQDPADEQELTKTWRIAAYQEGKPNPYVLDCTLAFRTFCTNVAPNCTVGTAAPEKAALQLRAVPNPFMLTTEVEMQLPFGGAVQGYVRSSTGQVLAEFAQAHVPAGDFHWPVTLTAGRQPVIAFLEVHLTGTAGQRISKVVPLVQY